VLYGSHKRKINLFELIKLVCGLILGDKFGWRIVLVHNNLIIKKI